MNRNVLVLIAVVAGFTLAAGAGTISGKVSGVAGESVVYVDNIAGKTFPAPTQHPVVDQKGLMFQPHIVVVQQGTTVEFLNSDSVAHNVSGEGTERWYAPRPLVSSNLFRIGSVGI
jgi:plastocyanin